MKVTVRDWAGSIGELAAGADAVSITTFESGKTKIEITYDKLYIEDETAVSANKG